MPKYSDDEFVEFVPASDTNTENNHAEKTSDESNDITFEINMTQLNQHLPTDRSEEQTNSYSREMLPAEDNTKFQVHYAILRDHLPAIIVFHCIGKLVESNCLVLHNTFKMCSVKNLPFIIFDMTNVTAVEKEVWVYFSSKVSKLQKLNGILLFAGIRSDVLSETTDFNKLNICHCDTVATCCRAIRNLIHDHEKTDSSMIFDEDDSSLETQSNIHDFLFNEKPNSELPEMKLVDSLLGKKKITDAERKSDRVSDIVDQESQKDTVAFKNQQKSQPQFSPFEQTILSSNDNSDPIAEAKRKVLAELKGDSESGVDLNQKSTMASDSQPQSQSQFSPFEQTVLINNDNSNPIAEAKRKVLAELKGDSESGVDLNQKSTTASDSQPQSQSQFSPFEQTVLINNDNSNPIAEAKRKILAELKGDSECGVDLNQKGTTASDSQHQSQSQFSPFEQTILINDNNSNPIAEAKRKVLAELKGDSGTAEAENRKSTPASNEQPNRQSHPELFPIEKVNLNSPGLFEKTILLNDENANALLDVKKKVLEELGESTPKTIHQTVESRNYGVSKNTALINKQDNVIPSNTPKQHHESQIEKFINSNDTSQQVNSIALEKTVLFNEDGTNPIAEAKKKVLEEMQKQRSQESGVRNEKYEVERNKSKVGSKEKVDSSTQPKPQSLSQSKSKPVVSDKSQMLSLKDLYIDDSMSTDFSIVDKSKETPLEDTDGEILPLIDESQSIDYSQNDKKVMSQSATVDTSRSSLGLTTTNIHASLKNISSSDPYSVHYGVYEKNADEKNQTLPAGKTESEKLTTRELIFKVIAEYGPVNILQLKNHINEKLDKKDRINTLKLFALLRQVDLDTHEKRVRYYRSC